MKRKVHVNFKKFYKNSEFRIKVEITNLVDFNVNFYRKWNDLMYYLFTSEMNTIMRIPEKGDKMYVGDELHISRGGDDVAGGLATVKNVITKDHLPIDHINYYFVEFEEIPGSSYNYRILMKEQKKLSEKYKDKVAHPDPDVNTPWIEKGDSVNGKIYNGPDIW